MKTDVGKVRYMNQDAQMPVYFQRMQRGLLFVTVWAVLRQAIWLPKRR